MYIYLIAAIRERRAKVCYSYTAANDDELSLPVGAVVKILKQEEEGWWEGELNGQIGVFPSNFVSVSSISKQREIYFYFIYVFLFFFFLII